MKYLLAGIVGYIGMFILSGGIMLGDMQYAYTHQWSPLCPDAGDYGFAMMYAAGIMTWPAVGAVALGHKMNEGKVPYTWHINIPRCAVNQPAE